ncbi:MAG TPA: leucine-rich repeat domain-containing protein [Clostridiaceae bacterium]
MYNVKRNKAIITVLSLTIIFIIIVAIITFFLLKLNVVKGTNLYSHERINITFSTSISEGNQYQLIKVYDKNDKEIQIGMELNQGKVSTVIINPPSKGYKVGESYKINVSDSLDFTIDNNFKNTYSVKYLIKKDVKIYFQDLKLEKAVRNQISKLKGDIYIGDVYKLINLNADSYGIQNIKGIEKLKSLRNLYLDGNQIKDLSKLSNLKELQVLSLSNNKVENIKALKNLTKLKTLWLKGNTIKDYSPVNTFYDKLEAKDFTLNKLK